MIHVRYELLRRDIHCNFNTFGKNALTFPTTLLGIVGYKTQKKEQLHTVKIFCLRIPLCIKGV